MSPFRLLMIAGVALLCSCATKQLARACPDPSAVVFPTLDKAFGKVRLGYHVIITSRATDAQGNSVLNLDRIGPAAEPQPEPGQGKSLVVVVKPCTTEVVGYHQP